MAFHLALYSSQLPISTALNQISAVADPIVAPANKGFLVGVLNKLMRVSAAGVNLTRVQLLSASIRDYAPFDIGPVNVGAATESPARYVDFGGNPLPLETNEELDVFGVQSNAAAQNAYVGAWFCDVPPRPVGGRMFTVHWTSATPLVAGAWSAVTPVLDNGIPSGTFSVVGSRCISATGLFHRFIPRGGTAYRPGGFMVQAEDSHPMDGSRYGGLGEWMRFTNTTLPQIEMFATAADATQEGYLDLIQVG